MSYNPADDQSIAERQLELRPKPVSVSPIQPLSQTLHPASMMSSQQPFPIIQSESPPTGPYLIQPGAAAMPPVFQCAGISQTVSSSQPRMSAQVLLPQQPQIPMQVQPQPLAASHNMTGMTFPAGNMMRPIAPKLNLNMGNSTRVPFQDLSFSRNIKLPIPRTGVGNISPMAIQPSIQQMPLLQPTAAVPCLYTVATNNQAIGFPTSQQFPISQQFPTSQQFQTSQPFNNQIQSPEIQSPTYNPSFQGAISPIGLRPSMATSVGSVYCLINQRGAPVLPQPQAVYPQQPTGQQQAIPALQQHPLHGLIPSSEAVVSNYPGTAMSYIDPATSLLVKESSITTSVCNASSDQQMQPVADLPVLSEPAPALEGLNLDLQSDTPHLQLIDDIDSECNQIPDITGCIDRQMPDITSGIHDTMPDITGGSDSEIMEIGTSNALPDHHDDDLDFETLHLDLQGQHETMETNDYTSIIAKESDVNSSELLSDNSNCNLEASSVSEDMHSKSLSNRPQCNYNDPTNMENFHEDVLKLRVNKNPVKCVQDSSDITSSAEAIVNELEGLDGKIEPVCGTNVDRGSTVDNWVDVEGDMMCGTLPLISDVGCKDHEQDGKEEHEFVWEDFLHQTGTSAVPASAFKHVEISLESGFVKGMKLEVANTANPDTYWVATVLMTCGPLLRLKYDGYSEDGEAGEFWCDRNTMHVHQVGWCAQNGRTLQPPEEIQGNVTDWREYLTEVLTGARTAPPYLLEKGVNSPVDHLKCSMRLEIQDALNPLEVWLVQILENVGGRLYLRFEGTESACKHFWMFYLNIRLHPVGWAKEQEEFIYKPPQEIRDEHTEEQWNDILKVAMEEGQNDVFPDDIFKDQNEAKTHGFTVGMKLEALIPGVNSVGPATVVKVINNKYFIVEIDDVRGADVRESLQLCCHTEYLGIFPVSWCLCKGIKLIAPPGWKKPEFVWGEYLSECSAKAAPERLFTSGTDEHEFERGLKLEAVNPANPNQICAATIIKIVGPLLWIHLDHMRDLPSHIEDIDSHKLFPVGWCESNNFQLKPPIKTRRGQRRLSDVKTEEVYRSIPCGFEEEEQGAWCPVIYFNHRCFSGPLLSKGRVADLPKSVGPGPMDLVLKKVLSLLVSVAYKSSRVLKEVELEGPPNPYMTQHVLKSKYKGKSYKGVVELCKNIDQLEDFCRNICIKLECCPYICGLLHLRDNCPENCQQMTKTKYNYTYGSKKKKPTPLFLSMKLPSKSVTKPALKRGRKKKSFLLTTKKGHRQGIGAQPSIQQEYGNQGNYMEMQDEGFIDIDDYVQFGSKRKGAYPHQYEIQTRGSKLPKYSFEKRTHKKVFMSDSAVDRYMNKRTSARVGASVTKLKRREDSLTLHSNPLTWSVMELVQYIKATDCSNLARIIKEQEVDGQAFLLLDLATIQEHLVLKLGPAVKLCREIERLKVAFYETYA